MLVEVPLDTAWKLVSPKEPAEKTRDRYRFAVKAEPGKPAELDVKEEQVVSQQVGISNLDNNAILFYINQKAVAPAVKAAPAARARRVSRIRRMPAITCP